jgi:EAL domain-containing protein (putative c-di-GMP-specific phosphodiesterase class I)
MELAEETGLIVPVGRCVLEQAGRLSQAGRERTGSALAVSINLSARQFRHSGLLADIRRILRDTGADPSAVTFEVTESMVMDDLSDALDLMGQMRAIGVNIAIDDFGTGHSSLGFLKRLPVQELKVDRSFVAGVASQRNDRAIVRAVIELAGAMNVTPVAEGVESVDQLNVLVELGCRFGQGYYLAPPMEGSRLVERLAAEASPSDPAGRRPGSQGVIRPWVGCREAPTLPV